MTFRFDGFGSSIVWSNVEKRSPHYDLSTIRLERVFVFRLSRLRSLEAASRERPRNRCQHPTRRINIWAMLDVARLPL